VRLPVSGESSNHADGGAGDSSEGDTTAAAAAAAAETLTTLTTLESLIPYEPRLLPRRPPSPDRDLEQLFLELYVPDAAAATTTSSTSTSTSSPYRTFVLQLMRGLELTGKGPCGRVSYSAEEEMQLCTPEGQTCCGGLLDCATASIVAARLDEEEIAKRRQRKTRRQSKYEAGPDGGGTDDDEDGALELDRKEGWSHPGVVWEILSNGRAEARKRVGEERGVEDESQGHDQDEEDHLAREWAERVLEWGRPEGEDARLVSRNVRCETACGLVISDETIRELAGQGRGDPAAGGGAEGAGRPNSAADNQWGAMTGREYDQGAEEPPRKKVCCGPGRTC
jgi:hypothetical protein